VPLPRPVCCCHESYNMMIEVIKEIHSPDALLEGAVAISLHNVSNVNASMIDEKLQSYADKVRNRVRGDQPQALIAHLNDFLFDEEGFSGAVIDYYNPLYNLLPHVLETKRGSPITLCLIYKIVAERVGICCFGVNLPGHFLVGIRSSNDVMLIDPFNKGQLITEQQAHERLKKIFGDEVEWSCELLRPASTRMWLTRIIQNTLNTYGSKGAYRELVAMLELEMLLWPGETKLVRDIALVCARAGLAGPAEAYLGMYLEVNPDDPQCYELKKLFGILKKEGCK